MKLISMWKVVHQDLFRNRSIKQLGNKFTLIVLSENSNKFPSL